VVSERKDLAWIAYTLNLEQTADFRSQIARSGLSFRSGGIP